MGCGYEPARPLRSMGSWYDPLCGFCRSGFQFWIGVEWEIQIWVASLGLHAYIIEGPQRDKWLWFSSIKKCEVNLFSSATEKA